MNRSRVLWALLACVIVGVVAVGAWAQRGRRGRGDWQSVGRGDVPVWDIDRQFTKDVFTFVRVKYTSSGWGRGGGWSTDFRDSDLNFSLRLQQMTSLKVNPDPIVLELTDPRLFDYPFLYMIEPGALTFSPQEAESLRRYCFNGGFMMVDDFWGDEEYENFYREIKQVFPNREPIDVPLEHEIFHCVYDLKEKPQMPSIHSWNPNQPEITWERGYYDPTTREVHYRGIFDDHGRIMVFICHNTDLGDGWEREGENVDYFEQMSVKKAYPMGINIVTYAMTH